MMSKLEILLSTIPGALIVIATCWLMNRKGPGADAGSSGDDQDQTANQVVLGAVLSASSHESSVSFDSDSSASSTSDQ